MSSNIGKKKTCSYHFIFIS